jgi:hypothetical protein
MNLTQLIPLAEGCWIRTLPAQMDRPNEFGGSIPLQKARLSGARGLLAVSKPLSSGARFTGGF